MRGLHILLSPCSWLVHSVIVWWVAWVAWQDCYGSWVIYIVYIYNVMAGRDCYTPQLARGRVRPTVDSLYVCFPVLAVVYDSL